MRKKDSLVLQRISPTKLEYLPMILRIGWLRRAFFRASSRHSHSHKRASEDTKMDLERLYLRSESWKRIWFRPLRMLTSKPFEFKMSKSWKRIWSWPSVSCLEFCFSLLPLLLLVIQRTLSLEHCPLIISFPIGSLILEIGPGCCFVLFQWLWESTVGQVFLWDLKLPFFSSDVSDVGGSISLNMLLVNLLSLICNNGMLCGHFDLWNQQQNRPLSVETLMNNLGDIAYSRVLDSDLCFRKE